jgi:hypothetical protein
MIVVRYIGIRGGFIIGIRRRGIVFVILVGGFF